MGNGIKIHPLNARGRYYVNQQICLACEDCFRAAPQNFNYEHEYYGNYGYYVCKQPENAEEETQCRQAMLDCPTEAISDDGEFIEWKT
jgi:ferredoxin